MTSLTGTTEMKYEGTVAFPPHAAIFGGCILNLGTVGFVWTQLSPLSGCIEDSSVRQLNCSRTFELSLLASPLRRLLALPNDAGLFLRIVSLICRRAGSTHGRESC